MWKGKQSKYSDVCNYIDNNTNNRKLIKFISILKNKYPQTYIIFEKRFLQKESYEKIEEETNIATQRINDEIRSIVVALRIYCNI